MNFNLINPQERRFFLPLFDRGPFLFFSRPPPICTANARRRTVERQPPRRKPQECLPSPLRPSECANGILIRFSPTRLFHLSWLSNDIVIDKFYNFFRQFLILINAITAFIDDFYYPLSKIVLFLLTIIRVLYPFRAFKRSNPFSRDRFVKKVLRA